MRQAQTMLSNGAGMSVSVAGELVARSEECAFTCA